MKVFCYVWGISRFKDWIDVAFVVSEIIQSYISHFEQRIWISFQLCQSYISVNTFLSSLKWLPLSSLFWAPPLLSITLSFFLIFYYFCFSLPSPRALFLCSSASTGNGFACHVTLVTDCVMDGILVRALLCLRRTTGQKHPLASHSTRHASHPAHPHPVLLRFSLTTSAFSKQPCSTSPSICWLFTHIWHYLSFCCVSVCCRQSIIVLYFALWFSLNLHFSI